MDNPNKIPQSATELTEHFSEQLGFLQSSAESFDNGIEVEAKRLANTLRLLLHETKTCRSLVGQIGQGDARFLSSLCPDSPGNQFTYSGLTSMVVSPSIIKYIPHLDDIPTEFLRLLSFEDWWNEIIIRDKKNVFTRKEIILHVADKDGGAHVDPKLEGDYAELSRNNSLGNFATHGSVTTPLMRPELATVRQIAHEILKTFVPNYGKTRRGQLDGIQVMGMQLVAGSEPPSFTPTSKPRVKIGRNDKCPCGSGKKFKHCHGI